MSVNLKGRKSAKSEQAEAPAPQELVMAGAQTPWATELPAGGAVSNPFAEQGLPPGMPTLPPPPPPFAPGEEEAEAPSGKKLPLSKQVIAAIVAVVVLGGGGYYYLNSGSSSSSTPPVTHTLTPAQLAALRAKGAAKAGAAGAAAKPAAGAAAAAKPAGAKPAGAAAVKPATPAKAVTPAKPATGAKAPTPAKAVTPAKTGTTVTSTQTSSSATYTAALPGAINGWDKLTGQKVPDTLASYDPVVGGSVTNVQSGVFGDGVNPPYLFVTVGDHSAKATGKAMTIMNTVLKEARAAGVAVSKPVAVPHTPWGGTAACATATDNDILEVVCAWSDNNTFGVIAAPHRVMSQALSLLNVTRASVEH
jgi:hypothetical protein